MDGTSSSACKIQTATEAAGSADNEDRVLVHGPLVAVFDGVTHPPGLDGGCRHSVAWYVEMLSESLAQAVDQTPGATLPDLLAAAIRRTAAAHEASCDLTKPGTPAAAVVMVRAAHDQLEYLILCDAYLITDDGSQVVMSTDPRFAKIIDAIRGEAELATPTMGKYQFTNQEDGYWIAAADPEAAHHTVTGGFPLSGPGAIRRAALLTDGASRAVDTFGLFGWRETLDLITEHGPDELIRQVRQAESSDANRANRSRFKRHDDATVALCLFPQGEP